MNALFALIATAITTVILLFVAVIMSTFVGGIVGWCVDLMFPFVTASVNQVTHLQLTGFETGACLGFVGSFFRTRVEK